MNVLILEPHLSASLSIAKFLKKYSDNIFIVGCWTTTKDKDNVIGKLPSINKSSDFDKYIVHEINQELFDEYSVIVPTGNISSEAFLDLRPEYRLGEIGFRKDNLVVSDKNYMLGLCNEIAIPIPYTYRAGEEIKSFPVFYKADHEPLSQTHRRNSGIIKSKEKLSKIPEHGYLVQEYIPDSSTFGVGFIAQDGKLLTHFIHEELLSHPKTGGTGVILKSISDPKLLEYTSRLVYRLKYHGWGLAEFKYCKRRNDYVFMEINARFWASFEFTLMKNPMFGKLLFGLYYKEKLSKNFIFINKLLYTLFLHPVGWLRYLPQILSGHCVIQEGWRKTLKDIIRKGYYKRIRKYIHKS